MKITEIKRKEVEIIVRSLLQKHEWSNIRQWFEEYVSEHDYLIGEVKQLQSMLAVAEARINKYVKENERC